MAMAGGFKGEVSGGGNSRPSGPPAARQFRQAASNEKWLADVIQAGG
jgi:hypothetical protein